jgi:hypothetical protein
LADDRWAATILDGERQMCGDRASGTVASDRDQTGVDFERLGPREDGGERRESQVAPARIARGGVAIDAEHDRFGVQGQASHQSGVGSAGRRQPAAAQIQEDREPIGTRPGAKAVNGDRAMVLRIERDLESLGGLALAHRHDLTDAGRASRACVKVVRTQAQNLIGHVVQSPQRLKVAKRPS